MPRKSEKVKEHNCYVIGFNRKAADVFMWQHKGCNMLICLEMREQFEIEECKTMEKKANGSKTINAT